MKSDITWQKERMKPDKDKVGQRCLNTETQYTQDKNCRNMERYTEKDKALWKWTIMTKGNKVWWRLTRNIKETRFDRDWKEIQKRWRRKEKNFCKGWVKRMTKIEDDRKTVSIPRDSSSSLSKSCHWYSCFLGVTRTGPFKYQTALKVFMLPPRSRYRRQILFYFEDLVGELMVHR